MDLPLSFELGKMTYGCAYQALKAYTTVIFLCFSIGPKTESKQDMPFSCKAELYLCACDIFGLDLFIPFKWSFNTATILFYNVSFY